MSEIYITIFDYSNEACAFRWLLIKDESTINASIDIEFAFFCYDEQNKTPYTLFTNKNVVLIGYCICLYPKNGNIIGPIKSHAKLQPQ